MRWPLHQARSDSFFYSSFHVCWCPVDYVISGTWCPWDVILTNTCFVAVRLNACAYEHQVCTAQPTRKHLRTLQDKGRMTRRVSARRQTHPWLPTVGISPTTAVTRLRSTRRRRCTEATVWGPSMNGACTSETRRLRTLSLPRRLARAEWPMYVFSSFLVLLILVFSPKVTDLVLIGYHLGWRVRVEAFPLLFSLGIRTSLCDVPSRTCI